VQRRSIFDELSHIFRLLVTPAFTCQLLERCFSDYQGLLTAFGDSCSLFSFYPLLEIPAVFSVFSGRSLHMQGHLLGTEVHMTMEIIFSVKSRGLDGTGRILPSGERRSLTNGVKSTPG
jgi:hypothetical protein